MSGRSEVVRHRLDEARLPAAGRTLQQDATGPGGTRPGRPAPRCRPARRTAESFRSCRAPFDRAGARACASLRCETRRCDLRRRQRGAEQRADDDRRAARRVGSVACAAVPNTRRSAAASMSAPMLRQRQPMPRRRASRERPAGVGLAVRAFVAVVVGEAVRQHDEQPPRCPAVDRSSDRGTVADRRAEARVAAGHEAAEATRTRRRRGGSSKRLTGTTCTADRPVRAEGVQRDAVAEIVQRRGQTRPRRRAAVRARCAPVGARLGRRTRRRRAARARRDRAERRTLSTKTASSGAEPARRSTSASTAASMSMSSPWSWRRRRSSSRPRRASGRRRRVRVVRFERRHRRGGSASTSTTVHQSCR